MVLSANKTIQKYILSQTQIIGRSEESDILLDDVDVSRHHALIRFEKNIFRIYDLGSLKGTFVNHSKIDDSGQELKDGDEIQLGESIFIFEEAKNVQKK